MPRGFWAFACKHACYIRNRVPSTPLGGVSPYEFAYGWVPKLRWLRRWGAQEFYEDESCARRKFDDEGLKCFYMGCAERCSASLVWDPGVSKVKISRDLVVNEHLGIRGATTSIGAVPHGTEPIADSSQSGVRLQDVPVPDTPRNMEDNLGPRPRGESSPRKANRPRLDASGRGTRWEPRAGKPLAHRHTCS